MIPADSDRNVTGQNRRILWYNLCQLLVFDNWSQACPTYEADSLYGKLLKEAADLDRRSLSIACHDHRVKTVLNPRKHLRVAFENFHDFGIRLLHHADELGQ
jgi:hypothetical protein